jgi:hypothetical protein
VWIPEKKKPSCQGPNYNFGSYNPNSSQYADHIIPSSLYKAFISKVLSRRDAYHVEIEWP